MHKKRIRTRFRIMVCKANYKCAATSFALIMAYVYVCIYIYI